MHLFKKSIYLLFLIFLLIVTKSFGQSDWKNWDGATVNLGISKKLDAEVSHLRSYDMSNSFKNNFNEWSISIDYDLTKRFSAKVGYRSVYFPAAAVSKDRFLLRATYRIPIGGVVNWLNGLQGEMHPNQKQYNYRIIYITRLAPKHRFEFLRLLPSVSYWLYCNIGGNAIQYYDEAGLPLAKETPDGIHRGRFILNLNSKINKNLSLSLYYLNQHEFNLVGNDVNVINPATGKVVRPFRNFQVAGVNINFSFDLYKKKHRNKTDNNHSSNI